MQTSDIIVIGAGISRCFSGSRIGGRFYRDPAGHGGTARLSRQWAFRSILCNRLRQERSSVTSPAVASPFFSILPMDSQMFKLLRLRDSMYFGREDQAERLLALQEDNSRLQFLDADAVRKRVPVFVTRTISTAPCGIKKAETWMWMRYCRVSCDCFATVAGSSCAGQQVSGLERSGGMWTVTAGFTTIPCAHCCQCRGCLGRTHCRRHGWAGITGY